MMYWSENGFFTKEVPAESVDYSQGYEDYLKAVLKANTDKKHVGGIDDECAKNV